MAEQNLRILITGGGSGIGAALAKSLSAEGHDVIICGRRLERLAQVSRSSSNIFHFVCDISDEESVVDFASFVRKRFERIDVIVNCAGLFGAIGRLDQTDSKLWKKTFDINMFGVYLITKHFLDLLLGSKVKKIINFSGGGAFSAFPCYSAYAASKAAVVRFSETLAVELADLGVQVNCIAPGFVATEIHNATIQAGEEIAGAQFGFTQAKLKEDAVPMELVIECVTFLISPESNGLTGKTISASFDKWKDDLFRSSIKQITASDLYALRRVNLSSLDEDDGLRKKLLSA